MKKILLKILIFLLLLTIAEAKDAYKTPPLPRPSGRVIQVKTVKELLAAVRNIKSNTTILVAPGIYYLTNSLYFTGGVKNIAIRGKTDNPEDVIIIGRGMKNPEFGNVPHGIIVGNVQGILIANLTIRDVYYHPIILLGHSGCESPHIYNCRLIDAGQQFIKANGGVDNGVVEYTVMEYTSTCRSWYTNGVDVHTGKNWIIRHCLFRNIRAPDNEDRIAGPAILMWSYSKDTICEGNTFINCDRGIAYGLEPSRPDDHQGGIIRNNFFYRAPSIPGDVGIGLTNSAKTKVLHNTIILNGTYPNAIEYRFPATSGCEIRYNLCDAKIAKRDNASAIVSNNITNAKKSWFINPTTGNLHLRKTAIPVIDQVPTHPDVCYDYDGDPRPIGKACDIGADEFSNKQ